MRAWPEKPSALLLGAGNVSPIPAREAISTFVAIGVVHRCHALPRGRAHCAACRKESVISMLLVHLIGTLQNCITFSPSVYSLSAIDAGKWCVQRGQPCFPPALTAAHLEGREGLAGPTPAWEQRGKGDFFHYSSPSIGVPFCGLGHPK